MRRLDPVTSATIDMVEASYDLHGSEVQWCTEVLKVGREVCDQGCGAIGLIFDRPPEGGNVRVHDWVVDGTPDVAPLLLNQAFLDVGPELTRAGTRPGIVTTVSEFAQGYPGALETWQSRVGFAQDGLGISAADPCGSGVIIFVLLPETRIVRPDERNHWQMLCAHLASAHRIRRAVKRRRSRQTPLPHAADAILDPKTFRITDALETANDSQTVEQLREAAVRVDRARGALRRSAPDEALKAWWAMMHGRWSMLDWFDSDQRRFVLAIPNRPDLGDPRGLTERELQVATYAALGESGKRISYRLGVSKATVSNALDAAMRKLAVKTQPQLVEKMRGFTKHFGGASPKDATCESTSV